MKQIVVIALCCIGFCSFQSKVMHVRQGEVFKVVLKANHSTGYGWYWENKSSETAIDSVSMNYVLSDKMLTGAGGNEIWEFRARKKGRHQLIMVYKRPWEDRDPVERREIYVKVE